MAEQELLLKPDYSAEPFWRRDGANVSSANLPLSAELRTRLRNWCNWFERSAYWEYSTDDETRYFATPDEAEDFDLEGLRLWLEIRAQTQGRYRIGYQSLTRQQRLWDPLELPKASLPPEFVSARDDNAAPTSREEENASTSSQHERRLVSDPVYAAAYHRRLQELRVTDSPRPDSNSVQVTEFVPSDSVQPPSTEPDEVIDEIDPAETAHQQRLLNNPVYARHYYAALERLSGQNEQN